MRPSRHERMLKVAWVIATGSTCLRRAVGCVLTDVRGKILATGYNGRAAGLPHCNEGQPCIGAGMPSGSGLDACEAIHAEQNALLQCADVQKIHTCYVTTSPCVTCTKLLLNTGCRLIVFGDRYAHDVDARQLWRTASPQHNWHNIDELLVGKN